MMVDPYYGRSWRCHDLTVPVVPGMAVTTTLDAKRTDIHKLDEEM